MNISVRLEMSVCLTMLVCRVQIYRTDDISLTILTGIHYNAFQESSIVLAGETIIGMQCVHMLCSCSPLHILRTYDARQNIYLIGTQCMQKAM